VIALVQDAQQASAAFFVPIVAAWLGVCLLWWALDRARPGLWPRVEPPPSERPWLDFGLVFVVAAALLGVGQLYRAGWLLPAATGAWSHLTFNLNTLIIYSPLFLALALRRQPLSTVYLSARGLGTKLAVGAVLALSGLALYQTLRGELAAFPAVLGEAVAHVPRGIESGLGPAEIAAFFCLNTLLPLAIFFVVFRSRDVVWVGVVHYLLDIAIDAF
jgi:hypothetical protein